MGAGFNTKKVVDAIDIHSGIREILDGEVYVVTARKEMVVSELSNDGTLVLDNGKLTILN